MQTLSSIIDQLSFIPFTYISRLCSLLSLLWHFYCSFLCKCVSVGPALPNTAYFSVTYHLYYVTACIRDFCSVKHDVLSTALISDEVNISNLSLTPKFSIDFLSRLQRRVWNKCSTCSGFDRPSKVLCIFRAEKLKKRCETTGI